MGSSPVDAHVAWWGAGPPPHERWPGVTIPIDDVGGRYRFDAAMADRVCQWFPKYCSHSKGRFAGKSFELLDYQTQLILRPIFGWIGVDDGYRRFRKAFIEIPKKNGKTQLVAGLALYMLLADGEPGAEVYVAAADREQARILFSAATAMVKGNLALGKRLQVFQNKIVRRDDPTAFFQVLSAEAATKHGPNIHCLIIDELHAQPDRDLFETLTRGVIARRQPLILLITTAGDDDESIAFEEYEYAKRVLSGTIEDVQHLPVIFEATKEDDPFDQAVWQRVNPGFGVTLDQTTFESFARAAENEPRKRNDYIRYHLNRWVNQASAWIPVDWFDACSEPVPSDEELQKWPCAVGLDMSMKIDLAAAVMAFKLPLEDGEEESVIELTSEDETTKTIVKRTLSLDFRVALLPTFWLPEETLKERVEQDRVPYNVWADAGLLNKIDGAIISADPIVRHFVGRDGKSGQLARFPRLKAARFTYDPAFCTEVALALRDGHGLTTVEMLQTFRSMSEACAVFEALVKARRILHGGHRLLRWNVENVTVKTDDVGRIRPVKPRRTTRRIDGVVAAIMAIWQLALMPPEKPRRKRGRVLIHTPSGFVEME